MIHPCYNFSKIQYVKHKVSSTLYVLASYDDCLKHGLCLAN